MSDLLYAEGWRDMVRDEIRAADAVLRGMVAEVPMRMDAEVARRM